MLKNLFYVDNLSVVMMILIGFVTICIASFSSRYLNGDSNKAGFYRNLVIMVIAIFIMINANNLILMLFAWAMSYGFLTRLMLHKKKWEAARQSYLLTLRHLGLGFVFLSAAYLILFLVTGEISIQAIVHTKKQTPLLTISTLLILLAGVAHSALWPFHRWLTSSLNSPTPVSAIMHAGLVNAGGFLMARFAPLLEAQSFILHLTFLLGIFTALLGTLWKLMQSDIKRTLACSTMGQMGFMIAQCGLGLFPAALAHLCYHGLYKAYLFLGSGATAQEKRLDLDYPPSPKHVFMAILCGLSGAYFFSFVSGKSLFSGDTTLFLIALVVIAATQFALTIIRSGFSATKFLLALVMTSIMGGFYGLSVDLVEYALAPLDISRPQPLNMLHLLCFASLAASWLAILFSRRPIKKALPHWMLSAYVRMLNASQPQPKTVTAHRNHYQF